MLVPSLGAANLMLVSAVLLEVAALSARRLFRFAARQDAGAPRVPAREQASGIGGSIWEGHARARSRPRTS